MMLTYSFVITWQAVAIAVLGGTGVALSLYSLIMAVVGAREVSAAIKNSGLHAQLSRRISSPEAAIELTPEEFERLREQIKQLTLTMEKPKRKEVLEALGQHSEKSRISYVNKLLHVSGLGASIKLKTT